MEAETEGVEAGSWWSGGVSRWLQEVQRGAGKKRWQGWNKRCDSKRGEGEKGWLCRETEKDRAYSRSGWSKMRMEMSWHECWGLLVSHSDAGLVLIPRRLYSNGRGRPADMAACPRCPFNLQVQARVHLQLVEGRYTKIASAPKKKKKTRIFRNYSCRQLSSHE